MTTSKKRPARIALTMVEAELCTWLGEAVPGTLLQYHRGFLALDVDPHSGRLSEQGRRELRRIAKRARWAAEQGLVHMVQRRHGTDDFSYQLVMRPRPRTAPASLFDETGDVRDQCTAAAELSCKSEGRA